jgi:HEAT repeat protein
MIGALRSEDWNVWSSEAASLEQMNIEQPTKRLGRAGLNQSSFVRRKAAEMIGYYLTELAEKEF